MSAAVWAAWLDSAGLRGAASSCLLPSALLRDIWEWGINWCDANCDASTESHSKCPLTLWACLSEAKGDLSPGFENSSDWQTVCHSQNWFKRVSSIYSPGEGLTSCWKSLSTAGPPRTDPWLCQLTLEVGNATHSCRALQLSSGKATELISV